MFEEIKRRDSQYQNLWKFVWALTIATVTLWAAVATSNEDFSFEHAIWVAMGSIIFQFSTRPILEKYWASILPGSAGANMGKGVSHTKRILEIEGIPASIWKKAVAVFLPRLSISVALIFLGIGPLQFFYAAIGTLIALIGIIFPLFAMLSKSLVLKSLDISDQQFNISGKPDSGRGIQNRKILIVARRFTPFLAMWMLLVLSSVAIRQELNFGFNESTLILATIAGFCLLWAFEKVANDQSRIRWEDVYCLHKEGKITGDVAKEAMFFFEVCRINSYTLAGSTLEILERYDFVSNSNSKCTQEP